MGVAVACVRQKSPAARLGIRRGIFLTRSTGTRFQTLDYRFYIADTEVTS